MRTCAFLTLEDREGFFISDHLLREPLASYVGPSMKSLGLGPAPIGESTML